METKTKTLETVVDEIIEASDLAVCAIFHQIYTQEVKQDG